MKVTAPKVVRTCPGGRRSRGIRRVVATTCGIALAMGAAPLSAQVIPGSIPSGSPLDQFNQEQGAQQNGSGQGQNQNQNTNGSSSSQSTIYEPVTVDRSSSTSRDTATTTNTSMNGPRLAENGLLDLDSLRLRQPAKPGEFETWAKQVTGLDLKRFGVDLLLPGSRDFAMPATSTIPPDYALNIGDTVSIALTGSVEGSVDVQIDRDGNIFLPNVGTIALLGVRYRDLRDRVAKAVGLKYRGYEVSVSIQRLRGVRVYVTGFANHPGAYSVNSLSTLSPFVEPFEHGLRSDAKHLRRSLDRVAAVWPSWRIAFDAIDLGRRDIPAFAQQMDRAVIERTTTAVWQPLVIEDGGDLSIHAPLRVELADRRLV